jgi:hypothetical protein
VFAHWVFFIFHLHYTSPLAARKDGEVKNILSKRSESKDIIHHNPRNYQYSDISVVQVVRLIRIATTAPLAGRQFIRLL